MTLRLALAMLVLVGCSSTTTTPDTTPDTGLTPDTAAPADTSTPADTGVDAALDAEDVLCIPAERCGCCRVGYYCAGNGSCYPDTDTGADVQPVDTGRADTGTADVAPDVSCPVEYADCDGNPANGCETYLNTVRNCGRCGYECRAGASGVVACMAGLCRCGSATVPPSINRDTDCDRNPDNGCEADLSNSATNCGACGNACPFREGSWLPVCRAGACDVRCIDRMLANCDGNPANGCEAYIDRDPVNCGTCGVRCGDGQRCLDGRCFP